MIDPIILAAEEKGMATEDLRVEVIEIPSLQATGTTETTEVTMDIDLTTNKLRRKENSVVRDKEETETREEAVNLTEEEEKEETEVMIKCVFQKTKKRLKSSLTSN